MKYEHRLMRSHLIKILETNVIEHFPLEYGIAQKILLLAVIKAKEAEAIYIIRWYEMEQQKLNQLRKYRDNYIYFIF